MLDNRPVRRLMVVRNIRLTPRFNAASAILASAALGRSGCLGRNLSLQAASEQLSVNRAHYFIKIGRFREVVVHLLPDASHSGVKCGIRRQKDCDAVRIGFAHRMRYGESIGFSINIEVAKQDIKFLFFDNGKRFCHVGRNGYLKSAFL